MDLRVRAGEHFWAERAREAIREAGGRVAATVRIPPEQVAQVAATAKLLGL